MRRPFIVAGTMTCRKNRGILISAFKPREYGEKELEGSVLNSSRFIAFYDAMLAIIMTIIVLSFQLPDPDDLWSMIPGFLTYGVSFFWLGLMWISLYQAWQHVEKISSISLLLMLVSLFFSSFFPFATSLLGKEYNSLSAQVFYGVVCLLITFSNIVLTRSINRDHHEPVLETMFLLPASLTRMDIAIKIIGLILCIFVWPPFMSISVALAVAMLLIRLYSASKVKCQENCNLDDDFSSPLVHDSK